MFADTQTITIDGAANVLKRVSFTPSKFQVPEGTRVLEISQNAVKNRDRFNVRFTTLLVGSDPLNASIMRSYTNQYWLGSAGPMNGVGVPDAVRQKELAGFLAWLTAANQAALFGGES